jgi:hypothetical protein
MTGALGGASRAAGLVGAIALTALAPWTAAAQDGAAQASGLSFVSPGESPVSLTFMRVGAQTVASSIVVIRNSSAVDATVAIVIIDTTTGERSASTEQDGGIRVTVNGGTTVPVQAGDVVPATVLVEAGSDLSTLSGVLVGQAREPGIPPATIAINAMFPNDSDKFASAAVQPADITVTATRSLPWILRWDDRCWTWPLPGSESLRVRITKLGSAPAAGTTVRWPETILGSDTGGRLYARLGTPAGYPEGEARLELGCPDRAGTYSGAIPFDVGNDDASSLSLTIKVQDLFIYPLLAVFAGAGVTYWLRRRSDDTRPKAVLQAELEDSRKRYAEARKEYSNADRGILDAIFDPLSELPAGHGEAATLFGQITNAATKEELDELADKTADLLKAGDLSDALATARSSLLTQLDGDLASIPAAEALRKAGTDVLGSTTIKSSSDADAHLNAVGEQAEANTYWLRAFALYGVALDRYRALPASLPSWIDDRARLANPIAVREGYLRPATSLKDLEGPDVLGMVRERLGIIEVAHAAGPPPSGPTPTAASLANLLSAIQLPRMPDRQTPDRRLEWLRLGDAIEFWIVAVIAAAAFLGTAYVGQAFGSGWQYLAAFVAGAAGTLAVNFTLLPWYRKYRVSREPEE